jgi:hypothetical protein
MKVTREVQVPATRTMEVWTTRYGKSTRIVTRTEDGKIVDNVSLTALLRSR